MSKIRINDLARELEVKSKEILDSLTVVGITEKKTHSSSLEDHEAELVRKHLRGRSDGAPGAARPAARATHGEEEIKTKIDLSHISRPGDVLRAITQQKGAVEPPPRPAAKPPLAPAIDARAAIILGASAWPAMPMPRKAKFPVMNAVNTLPKARKLIASTAPDETVSVNRRRSRTRRSLRRRSNASKRWALMAGLLGIRS